MKKRTIIFIFLGLILVAGVGVYTSTRVFGDTFIGLSLFGRNSSLDDGLVGHWTFDGGDMISNVADVSGGGNHGSLVLGASGNVATTTVAGKVGQALEFDGVDDYVTVLDGTDPTAYTISLWVKPTAPSSNNLIVRTSAAGPTTHWSHQLRISGGKFEHYLCCGANPSITGTTNVSEGVWYFVVGVAENGGTMRLYVNGTEEGTSVSMENLWADGDRWYIGSNAATGGLYAYFDGTLDDVRIYNRTLSADEIERLYKLGVGTKVGVPPSGGTLGSGEFSGLVGHWTFDGKDMVSNIVDVSGNGNNGALVLGASGNTSTTTSIGRIGQALEFDGIDDQVSINSVFGLGNTDLSIAAWVNLDSTSEGGAFVKIGRETAGTGGNNGFGMGVGQSSFDNNGNDLILLYETVRWIDTNDTIGTGWHHVAMTINSSGVPEWFIDGVSGGTSSGTNGIAPSLGATKIGGYTALGGGERFVDATIDDVRIYNRTLLPSEIERLYQMGR